MEAVTTNKEELFNFLVSGTLALLLLSLGIIYFIYLYQKKQNEFREIRKNMEIAFKQAILQSHIEIREQTLHYVSNELHDNIGQIATLMKFNLQGMSAGIPYEEKERFQDTRQLLDRLVTDVKALSRKLSNRNFKEGDLVTALRDEAVLISKSKNLELSFSSDDEIYDISPDKEIIIYRICQEIFNNILKHSEATKCKVNLYSAGNHLLIEITDNGKGFESESVSGSGAGLENMKERSRLIGAEFQIQSKTDEGTSIRIKIPSHEKTYQASHH